MMAAAKALASVSPTVQDPTAPLLPRISESRKVGMAVAESVAAQAIADGVAKIADPGTLLDQLRAYVWEPIYHPYERISPPC